MKQKKIAIIGAGLSGLTLAYFLNKNHPEISIEIFEKELEIGGKAKQKMFKNDKVAIGPKTVVLKPNSALDLLLEELNLKKDIIIPEKSAKKRWIAYKGKLLEIPSSIKGVFKSPFLSCFISIFRDLFVKPVYKDETVKEFFSRRFSTKLTSVLIDPMFKGIYGGAIDELSIDETLGFLKTWERKYGSVLKGAFKEKRGQRQIFSFEGGLFHLAKALTENIKAKINLGIELKKFEFSDERVTVEVGEEKKTFDHLFMATDILGLKQLFPEFTQHFEKNYSKSITQVIFGYQELLPLEGFGCLIPSSEKTSVLGVLFDNQIFKIQENNKTYLTIMIEGINQSDEEYFHEATNALNKYLNLNLEPDFTSIERYDRGIFLPKLGHKDRLESFMKDIKEKYPNVHILGVGLKGVGVADQIQNAYDLAKEILK